jgi:uncharacterized C2H2 Zn-finger protein
MMGGGLTDPCLMKQVAPDSEDIILSPKADAIFQERKAFIRK